jgi:hypothetical protein
MLGSAVPAPREKYFFPPEPCLLAIPGGSSLHTLKGVLLRAYFGRLYP